MLSKDPTPSHLSGGIVIWVSNSPDTETEHVGSNYSRLILLYFAQAQAWTTLLDAKIAITSTPRLLHSLYIVWTFLTFHQSNNCRVQQTHVKTIFERSLDSFPEGGMVHMSYEWFSQIRPFYVEQSVKNHSEEIRISTWCQARENAGEQSQVWSGDYMDSLDSFLVQNKATVVDFLVLCSQKYSTSFTMWRMQHTSTIHVTPLIEVKLTRVILKNHESSQSHASLWLLSHAFIHASSIFVISSRIKCHKNPLLCVTQIWGTDILNWVRQHWQSRHARLIGCAETYDWRSTITSRLARKSAHRDTDKALSRVLCSTWQVAIIIQLRRELDSEKAFPFYFIPLRSVQLFRQQRGIIGLQEIRGIVRPPP